ncbi:MAG: cytochrome c biogenesis protein ResB [Calditrichaeota bacterium]|nr:cytochrome c biogenesis protein ResB [Calditrichota bacterium]MCB9369826.1 cytochrome c biogenesis protein ResB [Calditrichota bacterium]
MTSTNSLTAPVSRKPKLWAMLSTMKFAIWILIILSVLSLASLFSDELIDPQWLANQPETTAGAFGQFLYKAMHLNDPFRSWWYRGLVGLLSLSLFACILERTPIVWRRWSKKPELDPRTINEKTSPIYLTTDEAPASFIERLSTKLSPRLSTDKLWVGESGRLALWGPLLTHLGLLFLAIGGLVGSFGDNEYRAGGYPGDTIAFEELPFEVRIDSFRVEFYPLQARQWVLVDGEWFGRLVKEDSPGTWQIERFDQNGNTQLVSMEDEWISNSWDVKQASGNIKQYISSVSIIEDGQVVDERQISVNSPLRRSGFRLYQSSYDPSAPRVHASYDQLTIVVSDTAGNVVDRIPVKQGQTVSIPGDSITITAGRLLPDFKMDAQRNAYSASGSFSNPAVELIANGPDGFHRSMWSFLTMQGHQITIGDLRFEAADLTGAEAGQDIATIFDIRQSMGTEFLWLGFIVSTIGLILCFYVTHRIVYVEMPTPEQPLVRLYAFSKKMVRAFEHDIEDVSKKDGCNVKMSVQPDIVSY